jgi:hypothetical protein
MTFDSVSILIYAKDRAGWNHDHLRAVLQKA